MIDEARDLGRDSAELVYWLLERTAEETRDGVRWPTLNYRNESGYDTSLYGKVAGITLFLVDYAKVTGSTHALTLAQRGLQWCAAHAEQASWRCTG